MLLLTLVSTSIGLGGVLELLLDEVADEDSRLEPMHLSSAIYRSAGGQAFNLFVAT